MKTSIFVILGFFLAGCASTVFEAPIKGKGYLPEHIRHEDDLLHHEGEILVLDPPPSYVEKAKTLGLNLIEVTEMPGLGLRLYHMRIDTEHHPLHVREMHEAMFPDVVVDVHHHFGVHATKPDKGYTGRAAIKWGRGTKSCGKGIKIGMIDSAITVNHPAFTSKNIIVRSFLLKGQKEGGRKHGTAVASVLVGNGPWGGLMPGATLYAAGVFHQNSQFKSRASSKSIIHAIEWMVQEKVDVINISLGGAPNKVLRKVVQAAYERGFVMIASVGNDGPFTKKKAYPAAYEGVIGIAANDRFDRTANFSSKGSYVEFSAPGVNIWTAVPKGGKAMSGTSFSSPIVTGIVAAGMKNRGVQGVESVREYLKSLVGKDRIDFGWDKYSGWGSVSVDAPC